MAGYNTRNVVTVLSALVVLAQLCSADSPAAPNENKLTWLSRSRFVDRFREVANLPRPRTCVARHLSTKQLRNEMLVHLVLMVTSGQERRETTRPESGAAATTRTAVKLGGLKRDMPGENAEGFKNRVVYPIAVNHNTSTVKYLLNAANIIGRLVEIKLWAFSDRKECFLRSGVQIDVLDNKKGDRNCVRAMKKRGLGFVLGPYHEISKGHEWISRDVTQLIKGILRNIGDICKNMDTGKLRLRVKAATCSFQNRTADKTQNRARLPYMEISKAPTPPLECTPGETRCCRQATTLSFKQLGLAYLLFPRLFRTGFCKGSCESLSPEPRNGPCCVPTRATPLSVLYFDQEKLRRRHLDNVVVKECGCRH